MLSVKVKQTAMVEKPKGEHMSVVNMKHLLEAGVHFGHQTKRWNPRMKQFIFTARNGIHIIDLRITAEKCEEAYARVRDIASRGGNIIFIGTKKQAQDIVKEEAKRCGAHYVNQRWFGGTLTNFTTIHTRIEKLRDLEEREVTGELKRLPIKEYMKIKNLREKLTKFLDGLKNMDAIPEAIFVTDTIKDHAAVIEARKIGITVIGITDTNSDPGEVDIPIPGNDDAIRSIKFFTQLIANAMIEGREGVDHVPTENEKPAEEDIEGEDAMKEIEKLTDDTVLHEAEEKWSEYDEEA
jgi:small subunit ribosomal protein S2